MSQSCATLPTLTRTDELTTQSFSTSISTSVITSPPTTITTVLSACPTVPSASIPCSEITLTSTIPGEVQTEQVPFTFTVDVTSTTTATLFTTSCTTINLPNDPTPPPTPPPSDTPPVVITNTSSTTQSNGSVITVTTTSTQSGDGGGGGGSGAPTTVQDSKNNSPDLAPIIGGVVGGFFGLIAIVALIWFILKRRRRWDDIFDKDDDDIVIPPTGSRRKNNNSRFSLDVDVEPKPYQYGLVGHATAPGPVSPPNSPPLLPSIPTSSDTSRHGRHRSSLTPLNLPTTTSTPGPSATTVSSRPSTAGSMQPLRPPSQHSYPQPVQNRLSDYGNSGSTTLSHTQSNTSFTSPPVSLSNWSSGPGPGYSAGASIGMNMGMGSDDHSYTNRSGSPTSIHDQQPTRRLQVANAPPLSPASETFPFTDSLVSTSMTAPAATTATQQRDGKGRLRTSTGKAPLVHLDGGRVQEELEASGSGSSRPAGAAPPAYEA